ncbi:LysR family transcriptional regulator [Agrococcus carbonis]|uniref:DNA-binding transcriptional regulator, LysR family n=1 Tax=Agrococcus carbonis TaxID=684552 RepID=A0A1H1LTD6_9MICO|nr:LysR substrate-binding domain-containing protein [Agrococcus carbonis]SDR77858.1 DNA-binding transcriptional regulator, LysR family [Agrococcus carbonis]
MNLEQLRAFTAVAALAHFTRAAERLHVAQPTLSRQVSTLERELGVELFHRIRGGAALTGAGERLLPIARRMLADADAARTEMAELAGLSRGRIRLGATPTLCTSLVVDVVAEFHAQHPGIEVEILERGSRSLIAALLDGALDLALIVTTVASGAARAALELEPIITERLVVVSSAAAPDPFATSGGAVALAELARAPQVVFPESYDLRVAMDAAFGGAGLTPRVVVEGVEMDAALRFAERGIGVAVVPAMVAALRPGLRSAPLADVALTRTVSIARRADMAPALAGAAMQERIRAVADRFAAPGAETAGVVARVR